MSDENDYDLEDGLDDHEGIEEYFNEDGTQKTGPEDNDLDENGIPYGPDNPKEEETEDDKGFDSLDPDFRTKVDEHHKENDDITDEVLDSIGVSKAEYNEAIQKSEDELSQEETGEIESDTLTDEEKAKEEYPDMAKDGVPYRQEFKHREEPDEELKKRYPDINPDDL